MAGSRSPIVDRSLLPCALGLCEVVPRFWLPGLMVVLVTILLIAHARGHYRLARAISFALLGVVTISLVLREFFLVTTLSGRGTSAFSVLVDAVLIWVSTVVTFAVWYWEIDGGGPDERARETHASEDFLFPDPAAAPMPARAKGANGSRFSAEKAVNPTTMNRARTASLMSTMIVFAVADSRTPRMSSKPHNVTSTIAGRLKNPPSPGAALMAPGMRKPNRSKSSSLRYCPPPPRRRRRPRIRGASTPPRRTPRSRPSSRRCRSTTSRRREWSRRAQRSTQRSGQP